MIASKINIFWWQDVRGILAGVHLTDQTDTGHSALSVLKVRHDLFIPLFCPYSLHWVSLLLYIRNTEVWGL